jgi:N-acylglucosamine 2-epimerase
MKFWWPNCEAIIATLMAYDVTRDEKYAEWHKMVHDWSFSHFPDRIHGEWYGYIHRDGRLSSTLKGNIWKGPFHVPRMFLLSWKMLEQLKT